MVVGVGRIYILSTEIVDVDSRRGEEREKMEKKGKKMGSRGEKERKGEIKSRQKGKEKGSR